MENNILDIGNNKNKDKDKEKDKDNQQENAEIKILNWEEFNRLKDKDSNLQYYSISDKNSITDMQFYFSKENTDHFFLSKY
jgi:hypothetical protein